MIVSQSLAQRMFPNQDALNRHLMWTDPVMKFIDVSTDAAPHRRHRRRHRRRERRAGAGAQRLPPVRAGDRRRPPVRPRAAPIRTRWCPPITRIIRELSADQPVEQAATLEDVRAEVLAPDRLNALVFGGFAGVALADRGRRRRRRAGVLGERPDARVRHPPGDRVGAAAPADARARRRRRDCRGRHRRRRRRRVRCWRGSPAATSPTSAFPARCRSPAPPVCSSRPRSSRRCCPRRGPRASTSSRRCEPIETSWVAQDDAPTGLHQGHKGTKAQSCFVSFVPWVFVPW